MTRDDAWCLLTEFTLSESLRKHALSVEACVRAYARKFGEDEELWGIVGLIHDFDYEKYPSAEDHPFRGAILKEWRIGRNSSAILSHANYLACRASRLEKTLFACDELAVYHRQRAGEAQ
jgi:predicted hydrolase (HD superfamily)